MTAERSVDYLLLFERVAKGAPSTKSFGLSPIESTWPPSFHRAVPLYYSLVWIALGEMYWIGINSCLVMCSPYELSEARGTLAGKQSDCRTTQISSFYTSS